MLLFGSIFGSVFRNFKVINIHLGGYFMQKKDYKGRCEKKILSKNKGVCRTYNPIQTAYADILQSDDNIKEIRCNVFLDGLDEICNKINGEYTSDFICTKVNGDMMVRECVFRKYITKPMTVKLLDASKSYWQARGVEDWGIIIDAES